MFCHLNITPDRKKSPYHNIYGCFGVYDTTWTRLDVTVLVISVMVRKVSSFECIKF